MTSCHAIPRAFGYNLTTQVTFSHLLNQDMCGLEYMTTFEFAYLRFCIMNFKPELDTKADSNKN